MFQRHSTSTTIRFPDSQHRPDYHLSIKFCKTKRMIDMVPKVLKTQNGQQMCFILKIFFEPIQMLYFNIKIALFEIDF